MKYSVNNFVLLVAGYDNDNRHLRFKLRAYSFNPYDKLNFDAVAMKGRNLGIVRGWVVITRRGQIVINERLY